MPKTVAIALGGSGGHIFPAREIEKSFPVSTRVLYMGVGLSSNPFFETEGTLCVDLEGSSLKGNPVKVAIKIFRGTRKAMQTLQKERVDLVLGMGSFHSFPTILAALLLRIPFTLFEPNLIPGLVNRLFSRWAKATFVPFGPLTRPLKGATQFIDCKLIPKSKEVSQEEALSHFGLKKGRTTLLVFGGSQGAKGVNAALKEMAPKLKEGFQILHFTGKQETIKEIYEELGIPCFVAPFCTRMDLAWSAADFGICRAGAGALREMVLYNKSAILIPFPEAKDNHQYYNALYMQNCIGGGKLVLEENLNSETLFQALRDIPTMEQAIKIYNKEQKQPHISEVLKRWI